MSTKLGVSTTCSWNFQYSWHTSCENTTSWWEINSCYPHRQVKECGKSYLQPNLEISRSEPGAICISKGQFAFQNCAWFLFDLARTRGHFQINHDFLWYLLWRKVHSKCKNLCNLLYFCDVSPQAHFNSKLLCLTGAMGSFTRANLHRCARYFKAWSMFVFKFWPRQRPSISNLTNVLFYHSTKIKKVKTI